jgi:hypothetical protein
MKNGGRLYLESGFAPQVFLTLTVWGPKMGFC